MAHGGYNLSLAGIFFPKTKEEVSKLEGNWEELEDTDISNMSFSPFVDDISTVESEMAGKVFCAKKPKGLLILKKKKLNFIKTFHSFAHHYPDVRTKSRIKNLFCINPVEAKCAFCQKILFLIIPKNGNTKNYL